jgi:CRP-like cAMP-binding protein
MTFDAAILMLRTGIERFIKIPDADWELLVPMLNMVKLGKHELFAREGERANKVGFVLEGNMRHYYTRDGEEKTTYFYFENHFVSSYISCITGLPSELTIEALTDCRLLYFAYTDMKQLYDQSPVWERFGRLIAEYLAIGLEQRMVGLLMQSPEERYAELVSGNKQKIMERIPQHYIANYLGITPVSLSRIRNRMTRK